MTTHVEVSPGGIGFVRTTAKKIIPGEPAIARAARRRSWANARSESTTPTSTPGRPSSTERDAR